MFVKPLTLNDNVFLFVIMHNSAAHLFDESDLLFASTSWTDLLHFQPLPVLKQYFCIHMEINFSEKWDGVFGIGVLKRLITAD